MPRLRRLTATPAPAAVEPVSRVAGATDIDLLVTLYRQLEEEQTAIKPMWRLADGLPEPAADAFREILGDPESLVVVGDIDGVAMGFAWCRSEALLPQAGEERVAVVRLIHTVAEGRGVGVGEAMMSRILAEFRRRGHRRFDARVSPGHRNAKNFFEANGFSARLIVMHHLAEGEP